MRISTVKILIMLLWANPTIAQNLDEDDVAKLSQAKLEEGIANFQEQVNQNKRRLKQLQTFNKAMCERLTILDSQCPTQAYLYAPASGVDIPCATKATQAPAIKVTASNLLNYRFRIIANDHYVSTEFGEGGGTITFQRDDGHAMIPPRFRQIISMRLVSVTPNSTINSSGYIKSTQTISATDQAALIKNMQFNMTVNGTAIINDTSKLLLAAPADPTVQSEIRIDPQEVLKMGKDAKCIVSADEVSKIRQATESAGDMP